MLLRNIFATWNTSIHFPFFFVNIIDFTSVWFCICFCFCFCFCFDDVRYSKKLIRLGRLLKESKWETWNTERNSEYDKMLEVLERLLRQLVRYSFLHTPLSTRSRTLSLALYRPLVHPTHPPLYRPTLLINHQHARGHCIGKVLSRS